MSKTVSVFSRGSGGATYEHHVQAAYLLPMLLKCKKRTSGEYYTPRAVTHFMVDMIDLKIGETVLDMVCVTGGILTFTLDNLSKKKDLINMLQLPKAL